MPEQQLNDAYIDASLQKMGGVAMPEGMRPGLGVDLDLSYGLFENLLESRIMHGFCGDRLLHAASTRRRKEPDWITVPLPIHAQDFEGSRWQWHVSIFGAFARDM